ncbi:nucleotidyltransferase substrate binding protein [Hymenobacter armeniacus]|uniref:Nucleotidyltransferase substrate binding protein n=1 Tax=Hymenobacter armeniacus TaxID=2771358 RepID=A0ABR8JS27_9BACT|nr:nucleotidyltransferase substrate binding protein [Hymenobacter armeniacus]MBD2721420.1 nucleotidyltransferase substrate binding protein [Hymenobacter armeniacus]
MTTLDSSLLTRCTLALDRAVVLLQQSAPDSVEYELYRSACVKEFEIIIEQTEKLLKKALRPYFASPRQADALVYKDLFRAAAQHGVLSLDATERWLVYRDNRNTTAHDYGVGFAEGTLKLLPQFVADATALAQLLHGKPLS